MKEKQEFLNEEKYQKSENTITLIAILLLIIGLGIGGYLIYRGVAKPGQSKVEELKIELENKKNELQAKGVTYSAFTNYSDGESYDLKIITEVLDPSFSHCSFDEYKENPLTRDYCKAKNSVSEFTSSGFIMFGVFICIATCMFAFSIFAFAKRRHILAFGIQQVMPVAQEGMEKVAPTVGKVKSTIVKEMAPVYGEVAKEISKGIKDGIKEANEDEEK